MPPRKPQMNGDGGLSWDTLRKVRDWAAFVFPVIGAITITYVLLYLQVQELDTNQKNHYRESTKQEETQDNCIGSITLKVYSNSERISKLED